MSPIPDDELCKTFVVVDPEVSVGEAARRLREEAAGRDLGAWYFVVPLPEGCFAVLAAADLNQLFEADGRDALDQPLQVVKGLLVPSRSVEQDEVELVEARFLRDSSHRQILVVLKGGVPSGLFVSRHQGDAYRFGGNQMRGRGIKYRSIRTRRASPWPLFDDIMEMAPADRELFSADEPAVTEQRRVHAQIRHLGLRRKTFLAGADNAVRCWIALPAPEAGAVADQVIPAVKLPPEGITLDVVLRWKDQTDHGKLHLPGDRTARSNDCDLHIHVPENERFVSAEVAFLYRGRAFEIVRVEAYVLPPGRVEQPDHTVEVRVQVAQREVVELADSNEVNMVMIYGEDRTRVDHPDGRGPTALQIYSSTSGASFDLKDPDEIMDYLNTELFAAETSLVRRRVRQGHTDEVLNAGDSDVLKILRTLARHGTALYNSLGEGFKDPGRRIQVQNSSPKEYSPVEFIYDRGWPSDGATICKEGFAALESDADDCPHCMSAADLPSDLRRVNDTICPFGFWSLQKIIERRDAAPPGVKDVGGQSFPLPDRRHLLPIDSVLFASSDKVPREERDLTWRALEALLPHAERAPSWTQWRQSLENRQPSLLLSLPHHGVEDGLDYLEVGEETLPKSDRWLYRGQLLKEFVNPSRREPGPIVLLLGCRTAAASETGYVDMARAFQRLHTSIVLGTLAKILGRHAAPLAREIIDQLVSVDDPEADFGTVMRRVRRRMLARGYLMALCLVALGDAEWRLTPRT